MMRAEFIEPGDKRWAQALMKIEHDFYHLPEYIGFAARYESGAPAAFYAEDGDDIFLAPLLIRDIPADLGALDKWRDATTPYGYPSPLILSRDQTALHRFLEAFKHCSAEHSIIAAFFRLHPLLPLPIDVLAAHGSVVHHGQTVYIDLDLPPERIWSGIGRTHRKQINRLYESGFHVVIDDWSLFDRFVELYRATMMRKSAKDFYLFSYDYFYDLREALGDYLHLYAALTEEGDVAVAGICVEINGIVQNHLVGNDERYTALAPTKLTLDFLWRWAQASGYKVLHLGGGIGGSADSLFRFKAGFSKHRADFYTYRMVLDNSSYDALMRHRNEPGDSVANETEDTIFPAYRKP